jgi:transcription termination/antitermination protein NusG
VTDESNTRIEPLSPQPAAAAGSSVGPDVSPQTGDVGLNASDGGANETPRDAVPAELPPENAPPEAVTPAESQAVEPPAEATEEGSPSPALELPRAGHPIVDTHVSEPAEVEAPEELPPAAPPKAKPAKPKAEVPKAEPVKPAVPKVETPKVETPKSEKMDWYILKVQSNREDSIREGLKRRVAIAGYEQYFGDIIVPTEKVTEFKAGKRRVFKRKLYPGYLVVQMEINEDTWFLVRETPGIGDFTGAAGHPTPMLAHEVSAILSKQEEKTDEAPKLKINFAVGDHVKIKEGTFENFEGEVASIDETNGRVTVLINIFGRSTPVDIEYWQIEAV